ncbi:glycosyltransferase family 1 protein [Flavobacterium arcticum]|uniref:Glycosyltransferase family 1 protein n=1 Tax=Flavobacterium arcticum TaxID=1784713 RepID=A0A345HAT3_9FLAO|nr:glycosyltransferase family 1 protein [Flavobacterium arcticum]AXG73693.1 glycosyltransferase family 1 protein [Flavobacterium arcticum]KAF2511644.1 glycosyltransferase family 4 protein [Flavobacterium arcticum]
MNTRKQLRIFVDCHVFDGGFQGTTTYLKGIYGELIKDETKQFYLAAFDVENLQKVFGTAKNVHYVRYASHGKFYRLLIDIPRIIKRNDIDFAHFQYITPPFKYCKYINTIHDLLFLDYPQYFPLTYRLVKGFLFRYSAKLSDLVVTVSPYSKAQIENHYKIQNVIVTPNAVDAAFFEKYDKKTIHDTVTKKYAINDYLLFVSRWEPRKNHDMLLKVFVEQEYYKNYSLVFVGQPAIANPQFDVLYQSLPAEVSAKILILNKVSFDDLLQLIRGANVCLYPSKAEGFGIPPLESAAAGVATACSSATAMADFDFFGNTLFDPDSEGAMHIAIQNALSNTNTQEISDIIRQKYDWKKSAYILNSYIK